MSSTIQFVKDLLGRGRYTFTLEEVAERLDKRGPALNLALQRLKKAGWVIPLCRGFYLALDVQHQAIGTLDPVWFVDDWARYMKIEYYVGGLSAAAIHGAAHQRPMQFQVFADRQVRSIKHPKLHMAVLFKKVITEAMWEKRKSPAGYFHISTPESTAYDIVAYYRSCPSLDHAATVLVELAEVLDAMRLAALIGQGCRPPILQRLGWLLDAVGWREKTDALHDALQSEKRNWVPLETRLNAKGQRDKRWKMIVNTDIQPDIER